MPKTAGAQIAVIGIDIGKNSFHVVGHDSRGAIILRQKWSRGQVEARLANLPPCLDRHGGMRRGASSRPQAHRTRARCPADAGKVCAALCQGAEERLQRCRGDRGSRSDEDGRSARLAGSASGARAAGLAAHRHHQSDPCLHAGTRHRRAPGHPLPAHRAADHPRQRRSRRACCTSSRTSPATGGASTSASRTSRRDRNDCPADAAAIA